MTVISDFLARNGQRTPRIAVVGDMMIDEYYKLRGWNSEGIPSKDELDRLGLNHVRQTLEGKGLL